MSGAFTDADYERMVRERDEALARIDSQRSQIAFYRTACTARFLPEGFGDETIRELINDLMEDRDDARSTIEDLNDEIARGREAIRIYRTETEAAKRERDQEREACAMYAKRSGRFAEQADKLQRERDLYLRERDQARQEADRLRHGLAVEGDFVCPNEYAVSELTAERNFLRALKKNHEEDFARVCKERDEARAEVERLRAEVTSSLAMAKIADEKHDQKCAEVDMLRGVGCMEDGDGPCGACRKCAYRRGAEAMRLACQQWCRAWENNGEAIADALADLRVEEP